MHPNGLLIKTFYENFQNLDASAMKRCYHPLAEFSDPAFPNLKGSEVGAMWEMLVQNVKKGNNPWRLEYSQIEADDASGRCHWEAHYTLSSTGRRVHNIIDAKFEFKDGLIIKHTDTFNFYRWARMGFGLPGVLLGWMPFFQKKVQKTVRALLTQFVQKNTITKQ